MLNITFRIHSLNICWKLEIQPKSWRSCTQDIYNPITNSDKFPGIVSAGYSDMGRPVKLWEDPVEYLTYAEKEIMAERKGGREMSRRLSRRCDVRAKSWVNRIKRERKGRTFWELVSGQDGKRKFIFQVVPVISVAGYKWFIQYDGPMGVFSCPSWIETFLPPWDTWGICRYDICIINSRIQVQWCAEVRAGGSHSSLLDTYLGR